MLLEDSTRLGNGLEVSHVEIETARCTMNSRELNVNVPLATVESDSEDFEVLDKSGILSFHRKRTVLLRLST